ncbi:hypothetical protein ABZ801_23780 [Actinomadura sp. NPDC047616]|uniref:hypothetical protein n=1 Tax=Actinomadura sp. NPDC047616 TaxID=3155914 RepID=UPI0033E5909C
MGADEARAGEARTATTATAAGEAATAPPRAGHGLGDRPNLDAGPLTSFGFAVRASIGRRPMRYLIARRLRGGSAETALFVLAPVTLAGTWVRISEDPARRVCDVRTFVPTMPRSVRVVERQVLGCLPLTEIGYLDLMAWRYPRLGAAPEDRDTDMSWSAWPDARACCYLGPASTPGLTVTEATDPRTGLVVARSVERRREPVRRWEIAEPGRPDSGGLPRRVRVSLPPSGRTTEFHRAGDPVTVPEDAFDHDPADLRDHLERALTGQDG